jgi:hypothetical protein
MNHTNHFVKLFAIVICGLLVTVSACRKEEIPGPQGDQGAPGRGGNANITSTSVFQVIASQWKVDTVSNGMKATIDAPQITASVIEKGAVKVFIKAGQSWSELPYVRGDLFTQFGFEAGILYLQYINIEGLITPPPQVDFYRLVIYSESP